MKTIRLHQIVTLAFSLLLSATSSAAPPPPPTSGPYITDPQSEYVQDATSDAIGGVNMVLCIMNAMNMSGSGMINVGPYVALIDLNKCQSKGGSSSSSSGSSGASAAVNYMTAIVDVTRASNTAPMIANVWMSMTEQGKSQDIYVKLTATSSPTEVPPYGVFRLDYSGKIAGVESMRGFIDSTSGLLKYLEKGTNSSNIKLALKATNTTSGSGTLTAANPTSVTYDFNYNTSNFRLSDNTNDRCFDRARVHADRSVWRYGTYNVLDGSRVDQANPSFQVTGASGGNSYYGYASYWGIGFQGLDLNLVADANPVSGLVVTDQRPAHSSDTFNLSKVSGKLTKWSSVNAHLTDLNGIPFTYDGNLSGLTTPAVTNPVLGNGWGKWQMVWSNTGTFTVTGLQSCGSSGCILTSVSPAIVNAGAFSNMPISGWSDSFGGNLNIPSTGVDHVSSDLISYFSQSVVIPGSPGAPSTLYCLSNCPDAASVTAAQAGTSGSPFKFVTTTQSGSAPSANTVTYNYGAGGLKEGTTAMIINNPAYFAANPNYQYGVQTGRLFDVAFAACLTGSVCEPSAPTAYYTWSTSADQWNQTMWLTRTNGANSGTDVAFDPPQNIQYTVPTDAVGGSVVYGTWGGKTIKLQFNGFGNLNGIPGSCVDPITNVTASCSQNTRYVPAFPIADGAIMTLGATTLIVKALDAEVRLKDVGPGASATGCGATLPLSVSLPLPLDTDAHDVSAALGTYSVGPKPNVTSAPKVIDGVLQ